MEKTLLEAKDYVRLNARSIKEIYPLYVDVIYETFGLIVSIPEMEDANFKLQNICNYHSSPIGKRTNWGGNDKEYPTSFVGWQFSNTRGKFRTKDGLEVTQKFINEQTLPAYNECSRSFWTTGILNWVNGVNTGSFNGGSDFMGCFRFFLEDFPLIENDIINNFKKEDIINTYNIKDWLMYVRDYKVNKLTNIILNE